jgi:hypothetical protein
MIVRQIGASGRLNMIRQCMLALPLVLGACASNVIQSVGLAPGQSPTMDQPIAIVVSGTGTCSALSVNWGDSGDTWERFTNVDLTAGQRLSHTYTGWAGGRTVWVAAESQCTGTAQARFTTEPEMRSFGWARLPSGINPLACFGVPSATRPNGLMPPLPANVLVRVRGNPSPQVNFGCSFNGCIYDPDGKPGTSAPATFAFPGFREYSLVLRLNGSTLFQGGKSEQFSAPNGGGLEFCQNTDNPSGNITGGWQIDLRVDQLGFPPEDPAMKRRLRARQL